MSTTKVSELTELSTAADNDVLLITDTSENASKKITKSNLISGLATTTYVDTQVAGKDALSELSGDSDDITEGSTNLFFTSAEQTKLSGIETNADVTDATNVDAAGAVMNTDTATTSMQFVVDEDDMTSNSATKVPTQQSVKAYVDAEVAGVVDSAPAALDTLNELAAALGDDANFATTTATALGQKLENLSEDTTPQLGGDLDVNGNAITGSTVSINGSNGEFMISATENGPVALRYDNNLKLTTKSDGVDITGELQADSLDIDGNGDIAGNLNFGDNNYAQFGASQDLQIYHDGSNSIIKDNGTGDLQLRGSDIGLMDSGGNHFIYCTDSGTGGTVNLKHNASTKLATTSTGINVTGSVYNTTGNFGRDSNDRVAVETDRIDFYVNGGIRTRVESDGDLHADGDVIAYSTTISDERLKENIQPIDDALSKVKQLKGCTFTYTADGKDSAGLIAQDVEKVLPSAVSEKELPLKMDDGIAYKTVQYDQTIGLLVEAIKELTAKVEELENK